MLRNSTQHVCSNGLAVAVLLCAAAFQCQAAEEQLVLVINKAQVAPMVLDEAEREAARIFQKAGIVLRWVNCLPTAQTHPGIPNCEDYPANGPLILQVVRMEAQNLSKGALGYATAAADGGSHAVVMFNRVEELTEALVLPVSRAQVLAHAMAHEMEHLLSLTKHTRTGIMRASWAPEDYSRLAMGDTLFAPQEAAKMCENVRRRAASAGQNSSLALAAR